MGRRNAGIRQTTVLASAVTAEPAPSPPLVGGTAALSSAPALHDQSPTDPDTELMLAIRAGNREAANTLVQRNSERITRYIGRVVRDGRAVEDLAQDVFLKALSHPEHYQPTARLSTWLYRIATNLALNYLKQPALRRERSQRTTARIDIFDQHQQSPERQVSLDEMKAQVAAAVLRLPAKQRVALTLFEYENCSYEQIAAMLDVSIEAVRSLLLRARARLRRELQNLA